MVLITIAVSASVSETASPAFSKAVFQLLSLSKGTSKKKLTVVLLFRGRTLSVFIIRTALSEAVTNCIVHGYKGTEGTIYISVKCYSDRTVVLKIKDRGCGISDIEKCREPLYTTDESGERGGMGFAIMESFTDKMTVSSKLGSGTTITLYKKLS